MKVAVQHENRTLIDQLLEEQNRLTAVEQFSRHHDRHEIPLQQKYYRNLIPLSRPATGEQYAFEVNLDVCTGCKACVTACHSLNGLDDGETWRKVGVLVGRNKAQPVQQTITTACHHCIDPGCLNGCPVEAYEKDPATGIVRHLDDQCIGCQYCTMTCPYDVPQYSTKRGIVRKCDMCSSRLAANEAPACVQACPNGAISIQIVRRDSMIESARQNVFLVNAPDPKLTIPSTRYISTKPLPLSLKSPGDEKAKAQPAHFPLVVMLVLTQMSVGAFVVSLMKPFSAAAFQLDALAAAIGGVVGLMASVLHLGRPLQAWRCFLGWRHSWLSREILLFGVFGMFAVSAALTSKIGFTLLARLSAFGAVFIGLVAVYASVMVYHATKRDFWHWRYAVPKFFGTTLILGLALSWCAATLTSATGTSVLSGCLIVATLLKLGVDASFFRVIENDQPSTLRNSAKLMRSKFRLFTAVRFVFALFGGGLLPFLAIAGQPDHLLATIGLVLLLVSEMSERYLFFVAVSPTKMPGIS